TTMASDILSKLTASRQTLINKMSTDFGLPREKVTEFVDGKLKKALQDVDGLNDNCYVVVATQQQMTAAMLAGWQAPMFHYNAIAGQVTYEARVMVTTSRKPDDVVLWTETRSGEPDDEIIAAIGNVYHAFQTGFEFGASQEALLEIRSEMAKFLTDNA